jgi:hypothetical protein
MFWMTINFYKMTFRNLSAQDHLSVRWKMFLVPSDLHLSKITLKTFTWHSVAVEIPVCRSSGGWTNTTTTIYMLSRNFCQDNELIIKQEINSYLKSKCKPLWHTCVKHVIQIYKVQEAVWKQIVQNRHYQNHENYLFFLDIDICWKKLNWKMISAVSL